jgi:hypothetical protein
MALDERPKASDIAITELQATKEIRFQAADFRTGELRLFRMSGIGAVLALKRLADGQVHAALLDCAIAACSRKRHSYARKNELLCGMCEQPMRFENDVSTANQANNRCPLPEVPVSEDAGRVVIATRDVLKVRDQAITN